MRQYINPLIIANTARMTAAGLGHRYIALVERDEDVSMISESLAQYSYRVIPASGRDNVMKAVKVLLDDKWWVALTALQNDVFTSVTSDFDGLGTVKHLAGTVESVGHELQNAPGDHICVGILYPSTETTLYVNSHRKSKHSLLGKEWDQKNSRRIFLIQKRRRNGLTDNEHLELKELQTELRQQLNAALPLPFEVLDQIEEYIEQAEHQAFKKEK